MKEEQKNLIIFGVLAAFILFAWQPIMNHFMPPASTPAPQAEQGEIVVPDQEAADPAADTVTAIRDRRIVLGETPRVRIDTPSLSGSINLKGARIDDLVLKQYNETVEDDSPPIHLLSPSGTENAYFAQFGWRGTGVTEPGPDTVWQASGETLTPDSPVTLTTTKGSQRFRIELSVDADYMFSIRQTVQNVGGAPIAVAPYGLISRRGESDDQDLWVAHVGPLAVSEGVADYVNYGDIEDEPSSYETVGGWAGFSDHYWQTALVPDQGLPVSLRLRSGGTGRFQADYSVRNAVEIAPGQQVTQSSRFFAGAKETRLIDTYEEDLGIVEFDKMIDWGWFGIVEKPIFYYLDWLFRMVKNFGLAIILLTITIRLLLFPVAHKQFQSMAAMRVVQPKMKALQERYKDNKEKLQQEMMKLYKDEKVNPLAGCLPMFLQIPIMFALYKVLILTIEMRHQPFILWINDLSAPDPVTPLDFFGYAPWAGMLPSFLHIGVVPILLGVSMYFQFKLNPQPMDDTQKQIFAFMPWVMMFMMAPFAVGLQIYWITSNMITIGQQAWLYSRHPHLKKKPAG
ncbi:membrane protein insertase YidC [Stakelama tenebrarum]|uniref:Membrane protein insertase YidC n=1 Tax=Stakelama tenebrarum TaxID=2711215 RepID=A0A6G6Y3U4_9SPHN|nr:membrane protein insertase YidC [Sphingosinithalassobacter tenebrarum]QIG79585.1 membrane protein insertase YidC [Sphingosinithalassobacter tenebrarum]